MRSTTVSVRRSLSRLATAPRLLLALALLALAVPLLPIQPAEAGGRARITAAYHLSDGRISIRGENFRPNARVEIVLNDVSQGDGIVTQTDTVTVKAGASGRFTFYSLGGWCPRVVQIVARDTRTGERATFTLRDSQCPW